jgi:predicted ester cyclase
MEEAEDTRRRAQLALIDRFYDDMWNRFDKTIFPEILHSEIRFRGSLGQITTGFEHFGEYVDFTEAFSPDFHNEVITTITEGNRTFARLSYTGTHQGEVLGLAPTGRTFEYTGAAVFTFRGDLIGDVWVLGDIYGLMGQLGARNP